MPTDSEIFRSWVVQLGLIPTLGADGVRATPLLSNGPPALPHGSYSITLGPTRKFEAQAIPLNLLINVLINQTGRTVIDKTGLTGLYDMKLEWMPDL
jgi:uncharacterized protein (TIGR03435 family)